MVYEKKTYSNGWQGKKDVPKSFKEKRGNLKPLMSEEEKAVAKVEEHPSSPANHCYMFSSRKP